MGNKWYVGQRVHVAADSAEWGRIASDGTVSQGNDCFLVNVDSIGADIVLKDDEVSPLPIVFRNAAAVRKHLKDAGYTGRITIRHTSNPFGGQDKFTVKPLDLPPGVAVVYDSKGKNNFFTSDQGETAKVFARLKTILTNTNCIVVS